MKPITVGKLKSIINGLPDNTPLVTPSPDHSYRFCDIIKDTVLYNSNTKQLTEDHGESVTPEAEYGKRIDAIIIE